MAMPVVTPARLAIDAADPVPSLWAPMTVVTWIPPSRSWRTVNEPVGVSSAHGLQDDMTRRAYAASGSGLL